MRRGGRAVLRDSGGQSELQLQIDKTLTSIDLPPHSV